MRRIKVNLTKNSYDVIFDEDFEKTVASHIAEVYKNKNVYLITDSNLNQIYSQKLINAFKNNFNLFSFYVEGTEGAKSIDNYTWLLKTLLQNGITRGDLIIAFGGGVITDLVGFVASTILRGVDYINIPTSLLGMADAAIGGKTGIDFENRKNVVGTFYQPKQVLIYPELLKTLPKDEYANGMAEIIKHAFIKNPYLLELLNKNEKVNEEILYENNLVKIGYVEKDERDKNQRMYLNFGHTFGHIVEIDEGLKHGFAVSEGMLMAVKLGIDLKLTNKEVYDKLKKILNKYGLPTDDYDYHNYLDKIKNDKKNFAGILTVILVEDVGQAKLFPMELN